MQKLKEQDQVSRDVEGILDREGDHLVLWLACTRSDLDPFADFGVLAREGAEGVVEYTLEPVEESAVPALEVAEQREATHTVEVTVNLSDIDYEKTEKDEWTDEEI